MPAEAPAAPRAVRAVVPPPVDGPRRGQGLISRWIRGRFDAYGRACLVGAIVLAALALDISASDAFALVKVTVLWCLGVLAAGFWLVRAAVQPGRRHRVTPVLPLTLAFLALCAVTTLTSIAPRVSLLGLPGRYGGLVPIALYVTIMFACIGLYGHRPALLGQLAWAATAAAGLMAVYVCVQAAGLDPAHWTDPSTHLRPDWPIGTMGNSNFAGGYLAIVVPLSIYALASARRTWARVAVALLLGLEVVALWYSQSRGGMIAAGAALLTMAWLARRQLPRWAPRPIAGVLVAAVIGAVMVIWHPGFDRAPGVLARVRTNTLESRVAYWKVGLQVALEHPLVGTGLGTYYAVYPPRRSAAQAAERKLNLPDEPHNIFIGYAAGVGVPGAAIYLMLVATGLGLGCRATRRADGSLDHLALAFTGALVGYLVQGFFSIDEPQLAVMGWICLGAIVVLARRDAGPTAEVVPVTKPLAVRPLALAGVVVLSASALLALGVQPLRASVAASRGDFARAMALQPLDASYPASAGDLDRFVALATADRQARLAHLEAADHQYRTALRMKPGELDLLIKLAVTNSVWADSVDAARFPEAELWWSRARTADPNDPELLAEYEDSLASMRARAGELAQLAVAGGDHAGGWVTAAQAFAVLGDVDRARDLLQKGLAIDPANDAARRLSDALPS